MKYNPDAIPPDFQLAKTHALAHRVGISNENICPCCGYLVNSQLYSLLVEKEELTFLGSGYPLYFAFIKTCVILLSIHLMGVGQFSLVSNYQGTDCLSIEDAEKLYASKNYDFCVRDFISALTMANKRSSLNMRFIHDMMVAISVFVQMAYLLIFRIRQRRLDVLCDIEENTPSDYTVMVSGLSSDYNPEEQEQSLRKFFEHDLFDDCEKIKIKKINFAYALNSVNKLIKQRHKLVELKKKCYANGQQFRESQLQELDRLIDKQYEQCHFSGVAFISFKYDAMKQKILDQAHFPIQNFILNLLTGLLEGKQLDYYGSYINVQQAPEPTDINWQSIYPWAKESGVRRIVGTIASLVFFIILTAIGYFITLKQAELLGNINLTNILQDVNIFSKHYIKSHFYALGYSLSTVLINSLLLDVIIRKLVSFQAHPTYSQENIQIGSKLAIMMFLNSAFLQYLIYSESSKIYQPGGLIYNITYFLLTNALVPPILHFIDLHYRINKIKQFYYKRWGVLTQAEANLLYEYPEHEIEQGYADVLKTMNVTFFFGPLLPMGYVLSLLGLILYYWSEKYTLLRRKTVNHTPSYELSSNMTHSLELVPIIYLVANILFTQQITQSYSVVTITALILAIIYHLLPNDKIIEWFIDFDEKLEYEKYNQMNFIADYDRENPVTKKKALKKWISRNARKKNKQIATEDYDILLNQSKTLKQQLEFFR